MVKLKYKLELWLENRYCNSFNDILHIMTEWYKDVRMCIIYIYIHLFVHMIYLVVVSKPYLGMMIEFAIFFRLKSPPHTCTLSINSFRGSKKTWVAMFSWQNEVASLGDLRTNRFCKMLVCSESKCDVIWIYYIHGQSFKGLAFHVFFFRKGPSTWRSWKTDQAVEWDF